MIENLSHEDKLKMIKSGHWTKDHPIPIDRFKKIGVPYWDFEELSHIDGKIIMLDIVSESVYKAFLELYKKKFPIYQMMPLHNFNYLDTIDKYNSTNGLQQYRDIVNDNPEPTNISLHSFGLALDLNPEQNPFIDKAVSQSTNSNDKVTNCIIVHANSLKYINPKKVISSKPSKKGIIKCQLLYPTKKADNLNMYKKDIQGGITPTIRNVFAYYGFNINGGFDWNFPIDLHHFQAGTRPFCERLAKVDEKVGRKMWKEHLKGIRKAYTTPSI